MERERMVLDRVCFAVSTVEYSRRVHPLLVHTYFWSTPSLSTTIDFINFFSLRVLQEILR